MSLEPDNAFPHMMYPILCSLRGRHDEAVAHAAKAVELDPLDLMTNYRELRKMQSMSENDFECSANRRKVTGKAKFEH